MKKKFDKEAIDNALDLMQFAMQHKEARKVLEKSLDNMLTDNTIVNLALIHSAISTSTEGEAASFHPVSRMRTILKSILDKNSHSAAYNLWQLISVLPVLLDVYYKSAGKEAELKYALTLQSALGNLAVMKKRRKKGNEPPKA